MNNKIIRGWKIIDEVGKGSLGTVYKAVKEDGSTCAIKYITLPRKANEVAVLIEKGIINDSTEANKYFANIIRKEIETMKKFNGNKYIIDFYDIYQDNKPDGSIDFYIRMEYAEDITVHFENKKISVNDVIKIGIDICSALELCDSINITHNDIKPNNIFIDNDGNYKLGDFSAITFCNSKQLAKFATVNYMAPEIYNEQETTPSTDIYSLGLVMYKLLDGELPFKTKHNDENKIFSIRMSGKKIPNIKGIDKELMAILSKACSFDSKERYQSATEMKLALEKISNNATQTDKNINFIASPSENTIGIYEVDEISELDNPKFGRLSKLKDIFYNRRKLRKISGILILSTILIFALGNYLLNRDCNKGYVNRSGICVKGKYYCNTGYELNDNNKCQKTIESIEANVTYTCKSGYTLSGDVCVNNNVKKPEFVYQCADGFTLNGTKCEKVESADAVLTYTCPSGYVADGDQCVTVTSVDATKSGYTCEDSSYTLSGTTCKKNTTTTTKATTSYSCNSGGTLNGTICTYTSSASWYGWMPSCSQGTYNYLTKMCEYTADANVIYKCSTGTSDGNGNCVRTTTTTKEATVKYSCPRGYTAVGNQCAKTTGKAATPKYICTDDTELKGNKCYATISTDAVGMYTCEEGYVASGTVCYKNDFPSPIKKYMCSRVYTLNGDKCEKYEIVEAKVQYSE